MKNNKILIGVLVFLIILFLVILILFIKKPTYKVEFVSDNMVIDTVEVKRKKLVTRPTNPVKEGYVFIDWTLNGSVYDFSTPVTENIVLTAMWDVVADEDKDELVISFNTDGGTTMLPVKIKKGEKLTKPDNPTKAGYKFLGWYYKVDGEEKEFSFDTTITENIELYAKWEKLEPEKSSSSKSVEKSYTVKFDSDGGTKVSSQTVKENDKVKKPDNPTKEGYAFREWRLNNAVYDFNSKVTKNITLKAVWTKITVEVTSVQLSSSTLNMKVGESNTLTAVVNPSNATDREVRWTTSNTNVATVSSNGKVTAIGVGTATITASAGGKKATCKVTVTQAPSPSSSNPPASSSNPPASSTEPPASSEPDNPSPSSEETPTVTYSIRWEAVPGDLIGQQRLFIVDSNGSAVSGVVEITYDGDTKTYDIPVAGELFVRSLVDSVRIISPGN